MASKPLQRSVLELKKRGYLVGITERFNQYARVRQDYCGFADLIAYHPDKNETLAIQACADNGGDLSAHVKKLTALETVESWVKQPMRRLEIWGWGKRGDRGKRKLWTLRSVPILHHNNLDHSMCVNICIHGISKIGTPATFGLTENS